MWQPISAGCNELAIDYEEEVMAPSMLFFARIAFSSPKVEMIARSIRHELCDELTGCRGNLSQSDSAGGRSVSETPGVTGMWRAHAKFSSNTTGPVSMRQLFTMDIALSEALGGAR